MALLASLAGCAAPQAASGLRPAVPAVAPYLREEACPRWRSGEHSYLIARRERACRERANLKLRCAREEDEKTRAGLLAGRADTASPECLKLMEGN